MDHRYVARFFALFIIIALLFSGMGLATAQETVTAIVTASSLNMRAQPNSRATKITTLPKGAEIVLSGKSQDRNWGYGVSGGLTGWVALNYIQITSSTGIAVLPVTPADAPTSAPAEPASAASGGDSTPPPSGDGGSLPAPVVRGSVSGGFELGGQVYGLGGGTVNAMRTAGMTWVKRQAHAGDGGAIGMIGEAHANGFRILLSVIGDKGQVMNDAYHDVYAGYVGELARNGADAIEIWNEQNIDREWAQGYIDPALYVRLLAKAYNAIKANNPGTIVITGAPAPTGAEGAFGTDRVWNDDRYTAGMAAAGAGRYADCIGIHYNEGIVSPTQRSGDPRGDNYPTRYFDTMLARGLKGFGGKKACFTELGYLTSEGYPPLPGGFAWAAGTDVGEHAAWLAQAAVRASNSGKVRLMIIFNVDFNYYGEDPQGGFAIIRPGGGCPACDTLGRVMRR
ncbi:MAG TPA: SH3 domain-containing protein [Aggregatilineales bacterium]|nr:SH3 domain-containing protein [Anaerolineales bacterium]HRE47197.1 SH3 domain-containing protein [Aggregatilineales bacterium]